MIRPGEKKPNNNRKAAFQEKLFLLAGWEEHGLLPAPVSLSKVAWCTQNGVCKGSSNPLPVSLA